MAGPGRGLALRMLTEKHKAAGPEDRRIQPPRKPGRGAPPAGPRTLLVPPGRCWGSAEVPWGARRAQGPCPQLLTSIFQSVGTLGKKSCLTVEFPLDLAFPFIIPVLPVKGLLIRYLHI